MADTGASRLLPRTLAGWMQPFQAGFTAPTWRRVSGTDRWRHSDPGAAHRRCRPARHRARAGSALHQLPSGAEPQPVVRPLDRALPVAAADQLLCPDRPARHRSRRHNRTALGGEDQGTRHLSRSGTLLRRPLRQSQRPTVAIAHVAAANSMGRARLGTAVPDRPCTVRAVCARA